MHKIFIELVNMSISASWLITAVLFLRFLLKKAPKRITHILWAIVGLKLLIPFSFESNLSLIPSANTINPEIVYTNELSLDSGFEKLDYTVNNYLVKQYSERPHQEFQNVNMTTVFTVIWVLGMIILLSIAVIGYFKLKSTLRSSLHFDEGVRISSGIKTPFVFGLFKPVIYIPNGIEENDLSYILNHERVHIRRKDHLLKILAYIILSVYWFNPLIWAAYIFFCRDTELSCDETVVKGFGHEELKAYSTALLNCSTTNYISLVAPIAFGEVCVKERVKKIMTYKKPSFWIMILAIAAIIVAAVCFLTNPINKNPINSEYNYQLIAYRNQPNNDEFNVDNIPDFKVSGGNILSYRFNDFAEWTELGELKPVKLTEENINSLFQFGGNMFSAEMVAEEYTRSWVWSDSTEDYYYNVYLIYSDNDNQAYYSIQRISTETKEFPEILTWTLVVHPSWNRTTFFGQHWDEAIETAVLEKNEGRLSGDFNCMTIMNSHGYVPDDEKTMTSYCIYLYRSYDLETLKYEEFTEPVKMTFDINKVNGNICYELTSYEVLDPDLLETYTLGNNAVFEDETLTPTDVAKNNCENQWHEYLEYLNNYQ